MRDEEMQVARMRDPITGSTWTGGGCSKKYDVDDDNDEDDDDQEEGDDDYDLVKNEERCIEWTLQQLTCCETIEKETKRRQIRTGLMTHLINNLL